MEVFDQKIKQMRLLTEVNLHQGESFVGSDVGSNSCLWVACLHFGHRQNKQEVSESTQDRTN